MTNDERITEIEKRLKQGRYYVPYAPEDIKFLLQQLAESQRREKAAVMDLKLLADAVRMEHCDDSCCFACMYDADFSIGTSGDFINECPGFSIDKCFKWRGVKGGGE